MSTNLAIRSYGAPYFSLAMYDLSGMDSAGLYGSGFFSVSLQFRLFALPPVSSVNTEIHPLFSFHEFGASGRELLTIGITPAGQVGVSTGNGADQRTRLGLLYPGPTWHSLDVFYDTGSGDLAATLDGNSVINASAADGGGQLGPNPGTPGRIMLFNGPKGISRTDVALRSVSAVCTDGTPRTVSWPITEKQGGTLGFSILNSGDFPGIDFTLQARYTNPIWFPLLYGPVLSGEAGDQMEWRVETEYTTRTVPKTVYTITRAA